MKSTAAILLIVIVTSCELVTEITVPEIPPTLVINGVYEPDSTWFIEVSQTNYILAGDHNYQPPLVNNVSVTISDSDGQTMSLSEKFSGSNGVVYFASDQTAIPGRSYTIKVSAPGYESATAISRVPTRVGLIDVRLDSANLVPRGGYSDGSIPIEFTFQDIPGEKDYYYPRFYVLLEHTFMRPTDSTIVTNDVWIEHDLTETIRNESISELQPALFEFDDTVFDGKQHTKRLHVNVRRLPTISPGTTVKRWRFHLTHSGEEYYKYFRSVRLQHQNDGNPFAQPVQIFSNVQGGLGIFAGAVTSEWRSDD